ncbi:hypothetical protein conserved [Entamoeba histolytica]|uniref:E3 ubiquitin-protein ligase n=4 Tax=Entamoeba histolytica TaxID=5759 RepID=B1N4N9_ENTH1|nr:hypothetical protein EHI_018590 [Entamoeba histolytica HM-1:IMSS]EDS89068.1 hypothetical protein EHI_018590 [Entamoeba histolytica HM-1:IMSS]ENY64179.1 zinc finger in N-recognin protein, putative [Entamoeba histolytica HM-1:IMSS-A]GAT98654.1 hypothetical protein conserved [Entamoeba histolytica]|eukprot:XP_001914155.1 hypothetical protein EHI_018590 [Entamoeba histolytica HM-1:IMSS]
MEKNIKSESHLLKYIFGDVPFEQIVRETKDIIPFKICHNQDRINGNSIYYRCRTCEKSEWSCICSECFKNGHHEGHEYQAFTSTGTCTCDCGNEKFWKKEGFCSKHGHQFKGSAIEKLPESLKNYPNKIMEIIDYLGRIIDNKESLLTSEIYWNVLSLLNQVNIFFLINAELLNRYIPKEWKTEYQEINKYEFISYFEYFYQFLFLNPITTYPIQILDYMTSFISEIEVLHFPLERIHDLMFMTINLPTTNEMVSNKIAQIIVISRPKEVFSKEIFSTTRMQKLLSLIKKFIRQSKIKPILITYIDNLIWVVHYYLSGIQPTENIHEGLLEDLLDVLCESSNLFPNLIKEGEHAEFDDTRITFVSWIPSLMNDILKIIKAFTPHYLYIHFPLIHQKLMSYINTVLDKVPILLINNEKYYYRQIGKNQSVSPITFILPFYTKVLILFKLNNIEFNIPIEDCKKIVQIALFPVIYKEQIVNNEWIRNGVEVFIQYQQVVSLYLKEPLLNTVQLLQFLAEIIGFDYILIEMMIGIQILNCDSLLTKEISQYNEKRKTNLQYELNEETQNENDNSVITIQEINNIIATLNSMTGQSLNEDEEIIRDELLRRLQEYINSDIPKVQNQMINDETNNEEEKEKRIENKEKEEEELNDLIIEINEPLNEFINKYFIKNNQRITSILRLILEIERSNIHQFILDNTELMKIYTLHMIAAGITSGKEILEKVPFKDLQFETLYDEICERKGIIRKEWMGKINPVFNLFGDKERESLLENTLFKQKSIKNHRYQYDNYYNKWNGSKIICSNLLIYDIIEICRKRECDNVLLYYILMYLSDVHYLNIQINNKDTELIELGKWIGINEKLIFESKEVIKEINGQIKKGFDLIVQEQELSPSNKQKNKKKLMLNKFKKMQSNFKIDEIEIEEIEEEIHEKDICVICQTQKGSPLGRMIGIMTNCSVEIERKKSGGLVACPFCVSSCQHYIHYQCFIDLIKTQRQTCPICLKFFKYFIPLSSTIKKYHHFGVKEAEDIFEFLLVSCNNNIHTFIDIIFSTIISYEMVIRHGGEITNEDKDIVNSLFLGVKALIQNDDTFQTFFEERKRKFDPLMFYIYNRALNKDPKEVYLSNCNIIMSIVTSSDKRFQLDSITPFIKTLTLKGLDQCVTLEDAVNKMSIQFEKCVSLFEECIEGSVPQLKTIDFIPQAEGSDFCIQAPAISHLLPLINLPSNFSEFIEKYSVCQCCVCNQHISKFSEMKICMICGKPICESGSCFNNHCQECSSGYGVIFSVKKAGIYLYDEVCRGIVVYENKFGEPYDIIFIQQSQYYLNQKNVDSFKKKFYRGNLLTDASFNLM